MPEHQAVNLLEALIAVTEQANEANLATLATKAEFSALGSQVSALFHTLTLLVFQVVFCMGRMGNSVSCVIGSSLE